VEEEMTRFKIEVHKRIDGDLYFVVDERDGERTVLSSLNGDSAAATCAAMNYLSDEIGRNRELLQRVADMVGVKLDGRKL
jgi:hypothetical protein